ncbi:chemotaxis protein CheX [bacterium]|mgnify:CR=1 FL=1|jgi:chemotaxis protein CheX|nr:chemotaxis protein CheX [bacterium]
MAVDSRYSSPFFSCSYDILVDIVGGEIILGETVLHEESEFSSLGFAIVIGLTGVCQGRFILDTAPQTALRIAEIMNMDKVPEFNDLVRSTFGELANMITGTATTLMQNDGLDMTISPPTMFEGDKMRVSTPNWLPVMISPISTGLGEIRVNLALGMDLKTP